MENLIKLPRVESKAPNNNTIEWELSGQVKFVYMIIHRLGHTTIISVKKEKRHWWNKKWETKMIHEEDAVTAIARGLDFLEKFGYTLDNHDLSPQEKMALGLYSQNDLKNGL